MAFALDNDWLLFVFSALILGVAGFPEHLGPADLPGAGDAGIWDGAGDRQGALGSGNRFTLTHPWAWVWVSFQSCCISFST